MPGNITNSTSVPVQPAQQATAISTSVDNVAGQIGLLRVVPRIVENLLQVALPSYSQKYKNTQEKKQQTLERKNRNRNVRNGKREKASIIATSSYQTMNQIQRNNEQLIKNENNKISVTARSDIDDELNQILVERFSQPYGDHCTIENLVRNPPTEAQMNVCIANPSDFSNCLLRNGNTISFDCVDSAGNRTHYVYPYVYGFSLEYIIKSGTNADGVFFHNCFNMKVVTLENSSFRGAVFYATDMGAYWKNCNFSADNDGNPAQVIGSASANFFTVFENCNLSGFNARRMGTHIGFAIRDCITSEDAPLQLPERIVGGFQVDSINLSRSTLYVKLLDDVIYNTVKLYNINFVVVSGSATLRGVEAVNIGGWSENILVESLSDDELCGLVLKFQNDLANLALPIMDPSCVAAHSAAQSIIISKCPGASSVLNSIVPDFFCEIDMAPTPTPIPTPVPTFTPTSTPTSAPISTPISTPMSAPISTPTSTPTSAPTFFPAPASTPDAIPTPAPFGIVPSPTPQAMIQTDKILGMPGWTFWTIVGLGSAALCFGLLILGGIAMRRENEEGYAFDSALHGITPSDYARWEAIEDPPIGNEGMSDSDMLSSGLGIFCCCVVAIARCLRPEYFDGVPYPETDESEKRRTPLMGNR